MKNLQIKKLGLTVKIVKDMQKIVDDTYYNLCRLGMYGEIYTKLQNIHGYLDDLLDGEHLDEDELDEIWCFYENNYKTF